VRISAVADATKLVALAPIPGLERAIIYLTNQTPEVYGV